MMSMLQNQDFTDELGKLIREQKQQQAAVNDLEKDLSVFRSGSAPPTVEGSLNSIGGLFGDSGSGAFVSHKKTGENGGYLKKEEELRADPAYVNYYYSNGNLNPRLPPPLISKEDWRFAQRIEDRRKEGGHGSLFAVQPGFDGGKEGNSVMVGGGGDWGGDGLIGLPGIGGGLGIRQKSIAEMIQDDMNLKTSSSRLPSRPASRNAFDASAETSESHFSHNGANKLGVPPILNVGPFSSHTYASALGASLSRNGTPDPSTLNGVSAGLTESDELAATFSGLNLSNNHTVNEQRQAWSHSRSEIDDHDKLFNLQGKGSGAAINMSNFSFMDERHVKCNNSSLSTTNPYPEADTLNSPHSSYAANGVAMNHLAPPMMGARLGNGSLPPLYKDAALRGTLGLQPDLMGAAAELQNLCRLGNHTARNPFNAHLVDPSLQYSGMNGLSASQIAALNEAALEREYLGNSYIDLLQRAYLGKLISEQNLQYGSSYVGKSGYNYNGNPAFGFGTGYPRNMCLSSGTRNFYSGGSLDESFASSLLDEFKSNKTRSFELSEIAGHVVEFSADQYGSRFIQQKLETATMEEKAMVFDEIMPQGLSLMTDVFGNYVIQKFLEHGTPAQIRELADKLTGNVLALSLQMYGCRVIQKAIEVVALDQKTEMVKELDGHVMRCVRDQNGNHVIQKCIECVPEDAIQFIVTTFYDQVVTLSTHSYGCRVIQRVLEHCHDEKTQRIMMDEILNSVCMLAQDQYGNYVVQHVLEHGKPHERSAVIEKLAGQIVQMSQQKFASNVIEKCLTFGAPEERNILVNEMLGSTDENEPLQVMMKDQFGNYVVQKVLETCDDQQLELILNRIKVHLNALKKYTYGKHIVARVEKLVAAGERRISILGINPS